MSLLSIQLSHEEYGDLNLALKVTSQEHKDAFKTQNTRTLAVVNARQSIGLSMQPRHLYSDYDPDRDDPKFDYSYFIPPPLPR